LIFGLFKGQAKYSGPTHLDGGFWACYSCFCERGRCPFCQITHFWHANFDVKDGNQLINGTPSYEQSQIRNI
jgi:hypothetical protein